MNDLDAASETLDRVILALSARDLRRACPRPCPDKKANKAKKRNEAKHVCQLVQGDGMTPLERMRNASPAQMQAQRYDRPGGRPSGASDPTGRVGGMLAQRGKDAAKRGRPDPDDETQLRKEFAIAQSQLGIALRLARTDAPRKTVKRHAKAARDAAHRCDLIVMRWGPPQPATQSDRKRLAQVNTTPPPDCRFCGDTVIPAGDGGYEVTAGGNLEPGPTCDWCASIAKRTGKAPTKKMINDHRAGRQVRIPAPNHVEAT